MRTLFLLLIAILPVYLICLFVYKHDNDKESRKLLSKLFIFGIISCFPAVILELLAESFFGSEDSMNYVTLFFSVFIGIAFIEEICKWFFVYKIAYNSNEFDHIYDAIVYCVFLGLGFAFFENIFYILDGGLNIAFFRAVSAIPGHACFGVIMGNYLGLAKLSHFNNNYKLEKRNLILSILIPTLLHGFYDFCLMTENFFFLLIFFGIMIFIYVYGIKTVKKVAKVSSKFFDNTELRIFKYCPKCGTKSVGRYCIKCSNDLSSNN